MTIFFETMVIFLIPEQISVLNIGYLKHLNKTITHLLEKSWGSTLCIEI